MCGLSLPSPTSWRDVLAAEACPPSSELRQSPPHDLPCRVPPRRVACPFEILRVPPRRVACPFEMLRVPSRGVACPFEILRVQRCGHDLTRVFPLALVAVVRALGLSSRVRRVAGAVIGLFVSAGSVLVHRTVGLLPPSLLAQGPVGALRRGGVPVLRTHFGGIST